MIYISTPSAETDPRTAKENISFVKQRIFELGALVIDPLKLGIPETWSKKEKEAKRIQIIQEKATALFLQREWYKSQDAMIEFHAIYRFNQDRRNRRIYIYFEEMHGFSEIESDIREGILIPEIPAA